MKKQICILLALSMVLALPSCKKNDSAPEVTETSAAATTTATTTASN